VQWLWALVLIVYALTAFTQAETQKRRIVVVISLDGFPAYALDDPRLPIPTLRKLAREGVIASSMQPVNPTYTWPNHTSLVTGVDASQHQVLFNGLLTHPDGGGRPSIEPWHDEELMVHVPTIYDIAYKAGLTTAQVDWVAIYRAKTITWQFPEMPVPNGAIERELIAGGTVTQEQLRTFDDSNQAWRDQIWTNAAADVLEKHEPNLLLFHLLSLDDTNHEYGPMSSASFTAMAFLDDRVKQILDVVQHAGLSRRTTLIIVSDHGFRTVLHTLHPNVLLRDKGLLLEEKDQPKQGAYVISKGGIAMVYADQRPELISQLRGIFTGAEGVDRVYGVDEFSKIGLPLPAASDQAPDLVLIPKPDYAFSSKEGKSFITPPTEGGTHGYLNTDPKMQAIFLAWGAGIPKGIHLNAISNLDVAPTIAALLGLEMKQTRGHAVQEIVSRVKAERSSGPKVHDPNKTSQLTASPPVVAPPRSHDEELQPLQP
jgi:predicted AlkP superfamily pyrophosphatase or phosphodiesterase